MGSCPSLIRWALEITGAELKIMAAAASMGFSSLIAASGVRR